MAESDSELLLACRRGDEAAWERLVLRFQRLIYTIPRRAGLGEDLAAEVFQEVFTTLLENINAIERPERLQAWLVTTARFKTWRVVRRERSETHSHAREEDDDLALSVPDRAPLPDDVLVKLEEQHHVRQSLGLLDERCRELLTLLYYTDEPPSYVEIARRLHTSEGSIGPTRARCLKKLMRLMNE